MARRAREGVERTGSVGERSGRLREAFPTSRSTSPSWRGPRGVRAVPLRAGWSDVGSWRPVRDVRGASHDGNLYPSETPVLAPGVRDTAIVVGPEGVLVLPFERERELRPRSSASRGREKERGRGGRPEPLRRSTDTMTTSAAVSLEAARERGPRLSRRVRAVDLLLTALLSRGHVLIEDVRASGRRRSPARSAAASRSNSAASSSRATRCPPTSSGSRSSTRRATASSSTPGRSSRTSCSPTRSTARRPRRSRRCSRR